MQQCRRLIEVDLPIKKISAHSLREKAARAGHISTLHVWWARRPLAACRAVILAALLPDPAAPECPESFRATAREQLVAFAQAVPQDKALAEALGPEAGKWIALSKQISKLQHWDPHGLRSLLLDFIADASAWEMSTQCAMLECARGLVNAAHLALGGQLGTKPLVVDPFAGGGAIPLEALRVGADAFAIDYNPVAVLLLKTVLEYIPRYGERLADAVKEWGAWVKERAEEQLAQFYPTDPDGSVPIAYLWARTVRCESPSGCNAEVPLIRQLGLCRKRKRSIALRLVPRKKANRVDVEIVEGVSPRDVQPGTSRRGAATCPVCGYTTPVDRVRAQLRGRHGGARDARMLAVVTTHSDGAGRRYRLPTAADLKSVAAAEAELKRRERKHTKRLSVVPDEMLPIMSGVFNAPIYGHDTWGTLFTPRQSLALSTFVTAVGRVYELSARRIGDKGLSLALATALGLALDKIPDRGCSLATWQVTAEKIGHVFGRQALPMCWDFVESYPLSESTGSWDGAVEWVEKVCREGAKATLLPGRAEAGDAAACPLPDDVAQAIITDPPYYNAVPYADLSDFFYVWLRRSVGALHPDLFRSQVTPKEREICEMAGWDPVRYPNKDKTFYEKGMTRAMADARRVLAPGGISTVVFAHKSTAGWEALLQALIDAGWTITASWPIDTEFRGRLRAMGSAVLASSVHLACRPRENADGSLRADEVGDWRQVLTELGPRVHEWMPRLAKEGVVGADAIFACLGPALEIFSRYAHVETAGGKRVSLSEYLEQIWAAVAREALNMIFEGADASGFEEDSRLTALWLWTLRTEANGVISVNGKLIGTEEAEEEEQPAAHKPPSGFSLEYDAARKIAQGLGAHLEELDRPGGIVEIKGGTARLLAVAERRKWLLGGEEKPESRRRRERQQVLFEEMAASQDGPLPEPGATVLDRLHQAMLLFADGRGETLRFFLTQSGAGNEPRFWRLAQALSALYPMQSEEKRWVDGVLSRKKALGF